MKILVYPVDLEIGGSEINAVDLATAMRDRGHQVLIYSRPGPLQALLSERGLRHIEADYPARGRPSPIAALELRRVVEREHVDLVHAYEGYSLTESFYGARLLASVPVVGTVYTMRVDDYLPTCLPLIAGTKELQAAIRARSRAPLNVPVLDPPIDVDADVASIEWDTFRCRYELTGDAVNIVIVSRLGVALKLDSLASTIAAIREIAKSMTIRLIIVGDGEARAALEEHARAVNDSFGRQVVVFTGAMLDPRPAYAAADVVVGMGTSALRAMAMEKPVIVAGERGFADLVTPESVGLFMRQGFWGVGPGNDGGRQLAEKLRDVLAMPFTERAQLGKWGRELVLARWSLEASAAVLEDIYRASIDDQPAMGTALRDAVRVFRRVAQFKVYHRVLKMRGFENEGLRAALALELTADGN